MPTVPETGRFEYPEDNWAVGRMRRSGEPPEDQVKVAGLLDWLGFGGTKPSEAKPTPEPRAESQSTTAQAKSPGLTTLSDCRLLNLLTSTDSATAQFMSLILTNQDC